TCALPICPPGLVYITTPVNVLNGVVDGPPQVLPVTAVYDDGYAEDITLGAIFDGYDRRAEAVAEGLVFFGWPGWDQISISVFGWRYMCYWDDFMCDDGSRGDCNGQCIENSTPVSAQIYVYTHGSECKDDRDEMIREYLDYPTYD